MFSSCPSCLRGKYQFMLKRKPLKITVRVRAISIPRILLLVLLGMIIIFHGGQWGRGEIKININTADLSELRRLPTIGPVLAQRIIDDREKKGLFKKPEEILRVFGIGQRKYELIKDLIVVNEEASPKASHQPREKLNLNTATQQELEELPGIGPVKARRIIQFRETRHGFSRVEDLSEIYGIGPKTIANLRTLVTLRDQIINPRSSSPDSSSGPAGPLTLKCWKCGKTFTVPAGKRKGSCPYCRARWELK